jgi:fructose-1,6-bisphosphatase I
MRAGVLQVFPMAYIMEHAGGRSISGGKTESLDIQPTDIHERCPIFLGSKEDVDDVEALIVAAGKSFQLS